MRLRRFIRIYIPYLKDIFIFLNYRNNVIETKMAISVRQIIEVNLEGGVVVDGFPSEGLVNAITSDV